MNKRQLKKCVAVAQDVLANMRYIAVTEGTYCQGELPDGVDKAKESAKKHIDGISKGCKVCALGACFLSYVRLYNNFTIGQLAGTFRDTVTEGEVFEVDYADMADGLGNVFTEAQMCLIESAFEMDCINENAVVYDDANIDHDTHCTRDEVTAAEEFGEKYDDSKTRLKAIMKNIIKNDGEFIPDKKLYDQLREKPKSKKIPVEIV